MLMAATHMMDSSSAAASLPPPWLPAFADHHQLLHDFTASAPSPPPPAPSSQHHLMLPRAAPANHRRVASSKRRPRRLPTTYINADPGSFRRMVHQVTGATHDLLLSPLPRPQQPPHPEVLSRPAPGRCHDALNNTLLLPTLDTSAFLIGAARTPSHGSASAARSPVPTVAAEEDSNSAGSSSSSSGLLFPTLESWDHATLF